MAEQCDKCGVEYTPLILESFAKSAKRWGAIEVMVYVVLGGYAVYSYFYSDSRLVLISCLVVALILGRFLFPIDRSLCDKCIDE